MNSDNTDLSVIFKQLGATKNGLTTKEANEKLAKFGYNEIAKKDQFDFGKKIFAQFSDLLVILLIIAGVLSLIFQSYRDATVMFLIVLINAAIGFSQEFKTQKILQKLNAILPRKCFCLRDGKKQEILSKMLIPGDIIYLQAGDYIPADARIIKTYSFSSDESALTGESNPQHKHLHDNNANHHQAKINCVYMGTLCVQGEAEAIVYGTGKNTQFGKIAQETGEIKQDLSPLQKKMRQVGKTVSWIAGIVLIIMLIYGYFTHETLLNSFLFALALAAAVVPEGLPATISVALSIGASRLAKRKALVKRLSAVESLGSIDVICTDKTGTLTEGKMAVHSIFLPQYNKSFLFENVEKNSIKKILENFSLCQNVKQSSNKLIGDLNEIAFVKAAQEKKYDPFELRKHYKKLAEFSFSSSRGMMSVILQNPKNKKSLLVYAKGNPLKIIHHLKEKEIQKQNIIAQLDKMASQGLRVMAFAHKEIKGNFKNKKHFHEHEIHSDLIFDCLVGLRDEPRKEVPYAAKMCHKAGINIVMLTGDYGITAKAIADEIGLFGKNNPVLISREELLESTSAELQTKLNSPAIFYQILPQDKLKIVEILQNMGKIVAVTGDGVNDAPALKKADIGVAMGIAGTDVAKEAADMVLLDDNFATIVNAIKEGRLTWDNLKKFLFYVFASNAGEFMTIVIGMILVLPALPILAVQILAVDLGTDVLPSIALASDPANDDIMTRNPKSNKEILLSKSVLLRLLYVGIIMGGGAVLAFLLTMKLTNNYIAATTASYTTLVLCQIVNAFSIRDNKKSLFVGIFSNLSLWGAELISTILLLSIIFLPPIQKFLSTGPFPVQTLFLIFGVVIFFVIVEETKKAILRSKTR